MSAQAGWYPDPGGGQGLYRYWDGKAWSAATSPNPAAPAPAPSLGVPPPSGPAGAGQPAGAQPLGTGGHGQGAYSQGAYGQGAYGQGAYGQGSGYGQAYTGYQAAQKKRSPVGWWLGAAALLLVIVVVAVVVVRGLGGGGAVANPQGGQGSQNACPAQQTPGLESPAPEPGDGRVHGGPLSYPELGSPWGAPRPDYRVPFGSDVASQFVTVEPNYDGNSNWVASVLVGELQAGDGFYTPQQGSQVVVKCILGAFYGNNEVKSNVKVNQAARIDGHDAWIVESQLTFDIPNLTTKGELLIVAIVATGSTAGLYYASIPDTTPELVQPARNALKNLQVDS